MKGPKVKMVKIPTKIFETTTLAFSLGSPSHRMTIFWSPEVVPYFSMCEKKRIGIPRISRVFFFAVKNQQQVHVLVFSQQISVLSLG